MLLKVHFNKNKFFKLFSANFISTCVVVQSHTNYLTIRYDGDHIMGIISYDPIVEVKMGEKNC